MTAIKSGTLVYKDKDGNTGIVKSLSDNDVSTINQALADVKEIKEGIAGNYVTTNTEQTISADKEFTGTVTVPSAAAEDKSTQVANTAWTHDNYLSLDNTVQTAGVGKRFANQVSVLCSNSTLSTAIASGVGSDHLMFLDKENNIMAETVLEQSANGSNEYKNYVRNAKNGTTVQAFLSVKVDAEGNTFSYATPTAAATASGDEIITAKWIRANIHSAYNNNSNVEIETAAHNNFFRGANLLGSGHFASMSALYTAISAADWSDIYVGDYVDLSLTDNGSTATRRFRVAGIDTALNIMSGNITKHHLVMIPDIPIRYAYMNSTNTTVGAYTGSYMYTTVLPSILTSLSGSSSSPFYGHIIAHNEYLTNSMSTNYTSANCPWATGVSNGCGWVSQSLVLMSTREVFGATSWDSSGFDSEVMNRQLPLFRLAPHFIGGGYTSSGAFQRDTWWLRSVAASTAFCNAHYNGHAGHYNASASYGVRPRFLIG